MARVCGESIFGIDFSPDIYKMFLDHKKLKGIKQDRDNLRVMMKEYKLKVWDREYDGH